MVGHRLAATGFALLVLAAGASRVTAQEERSKSEGTRFDRMEGLETKLGLNDQQKQEVKKIQSDFDRRMEAAERQLWKLHQQEEAAVGKILTEDQRGKLKAALKAAWDAETQKVANRLNLNDDQKQRLQKLRDEVGPKFTALAEKQGEDTFNDIRELRARVHKEMRQVLTEEQRAKLPAIMHEEFHKWHDAAARAEKLKMLGDRLGLKDDQREQLQKVMADFNRQMEQPAAQFKQLHKEEVAAIEKVLTPEQRQKFEAMFRDRRDQK